MFASDINAITRRGTENTSNSFQVLSAIGDSIPVGELPGLSWNRDADPLFDKLVPNPKGEVKEQRGRDRARRVPSWGSMKREGKLDVR
jgi:hypothetical protein